MTSPLSDEVKLLRENSRLKLLNTSLRRENELLKRRSGGFAIDSAIEELKLFLEVCPDSKLITTPTNYAVPKALVKSPFSKSHSETAVHAFSDWHISETVRAADANGINEYNSVIASNRIWEDVQKVKRILAGHAALYKLTDFHLLCLGDFINGSIHEELKLTNDLLDVPASVLAARLLQMAIEEFKTIGLPIEVDCVVGNHPRLTIKMPTKRQAHLSMDYLVYEMVANAFKNDAQVKINVHTGQIAIKNIRGWRYIIEHGIDVRSGDEEKFEDRIRGLYDDSTYREVTGMRGSSFDAIVIGNMHKPKWLERVIVNGCLTGQNELGVAWRLKMIKAQQFLWGVTDELVRSFQYAIDVTKINSKKAENRFSEYAVWFMKRHGR